MNNEKKNLQNLFRNRFDEEKCVECHICKKPFKNGAALNGHMRLHGGFNEVYFPKKKKLFLIRISFI